MFKTLGINPEESFMPLQDSRTDDQWSTMKDLAGILVFSVALLPTLPVVAADFPAISHAEKALIEVEGYLGCPAVILFRSGRLEMEPEGKGSGSILQIKGRIKILTEEGQRYGNLKLHHAFVSGFSGRTTLSDGTTQEVEKDRVLECQQTQPGNSCTTVVSMPGVEVGAIIDYQYSVKHPSILEFKPWLFQGRVPTLKSRIAYVIPAYIGAHPWIRAPQDLIDIKTDQLPSGRVVQATMRNMPDIPDEPLSFPIEDLSSQIVMLPTHYIVEDSGYPLLATWDYAAGMFYGDYDRFKKGRATKKRARALVKGKSESDKARTLFQWVRDSIELEPRLGVAVRASATVDQLIQDGRGTPTEKALLLQAMLDAVKIDADPVWVTYRSSGVADMRTPNPGWFDTTIVRAMINGLPVYLDPSDRRCGFSHLSPELEGTQALILGRRLPPMLVDAEVIDAFQGIRLGGSFDVGNAGVSTPYGRPDVAQGVDPVARRLVGGEQVAQLVTLPTTPFRASRRHASIELVLDHDGSVTGSGSLELTGNQAWFNMTRKDSTELNAHWQAWLEEALSTSEVNLTEATEDPANRRILVSWRLKQPLKDVAANEVSLQLSRPLGPITQPFDALTRYTPAFLEFTSRDELELSLAWSEGWVLDVVPEQWERQGFAGEAIATVKLDEDNRNLQYTRRVDFASQEFPDSDQLTDLVLLYDEAQQHDEQLLVFIRP
ncbi:MAG: DUF3857 and transglutaminase domain-containing protein [bacterium]|nr:DUF3857 and transglutaminase domain-containing protein [bacterium]